MSEQRYGWVRVGDDAFGLVDTGQIVAIVHRSGPRLGVDEASEPVVTESGYFFVECAHPSENVWFADESLDWEQARLRAAVEWHARREARGEDH